MRGCNGGGTPTARSARARSNPLPVRTQPESATWHPVRSASRTMQNDPHIDPVDPADRGAPGGRSIFDISQHHARALAALRHRPVAASRSANCLPRFRPTLALQMPAARMLRDGSTVSTHCSDPLHRRQPAARRPSLDRPLRPQPPAALVADAPVRQWLENRTAPADRSYRGTPDRSARESR